MKKLLLSQNKISEIKVLEQFTFEKLELLDLTDNRIDVKQKNLLILSQIKYYERWFWAIYIIKKNEFKI